MKKYQTLFFDLDGTLWDLQHNTQVTLELLFEKEAKSTFEGIQFKTFLRHYHLQNNYCWDLYNRGKLEKHELRIVRFKRAFADVGIHPNDLFIQQFADEFLEICPRQGALVSGTLELLNYCADNYSMSIITNGFKEVQHLKLEAGGIANFFDHIINSEDAQAKKPATRIFQHALDLCGAEKSSSLMIGDDWHADMVGARNFGMDQAFLSTTERMLNTFAIDKQRKISRHNFKSTYMVESLNELIAVL